MLTVSLLALACGLAMDAVAAAVAQGAATRPPRPADAARLGAAFGLAQALLPLAGWALGVAFAPIVQAADHWIALLVLGVLGGRMIHQGLDGDAQAPARRLTGARLAAAALATSIDAAAAGVTLPALGAPVLLACAVIGIVTAGLSFAGYFAGAAIGQRLGAAAEIAGGILLIALGGKIFIHHQFMGG